MPSPDPGDERTPAGEAGAREESADRLIQEHDTPHRYPPTYMAARRALPKTPAHKPNFRAAYPKARARWRDDEALARRVAELVVAELKGVA